MAARRRRRPDELVDESKRGTDWTADELDAIVADYFAMLANEQLGHRYNKARHNATLVQRIGRTRAAIEFKHRNISAVLRELGMPEIEGYKASDELSGRDLRCD